MAYLRGGQEFPDGLHAEITEHLTRLEDEAGKRLGDHDNPLLVSVRSGAKFSMPGMMDTVLNLGLNDRSVEGLAARTGNPRFAYDSYRRFIQMFGDVVSEVEKRHFEEALSALKAARGATADVDLTAATCRAWWRRTRRSTTSTRASRFRRTPAPSWKARFGRCSTRGTTAARRTIGACTTSPGPSAPPSTCSKWCSATPASTPGPAWRSRATTSRASGASRLATS